MSQLFKELCVYIVELGSRVVPVIVKGKELDPLKVKIYFFFSKSGKRLGTFILDRYK